MENTQEHILVVDDDAGLRALLEQYLTGQGYTVTCAADGGKMDEALTRISPDLVILDLMLPGEDGLSIARRLRASTALPIIMLSARGEDIDRIVGLEVGADDYLPKPFNPRELLARIRAVLRRRQATLGAAAAPNNVARFGPFSLDLDAQRLLRDSEEIPITTAEFAILRIFVEHPNRVLTRDGLMDMIKGYERDPFDRSIDVRVTRLRRKIEPDPANPVFIRTVWGQGYLFAPKGAAA
ncbi:DNA-binding response regulator [Sulfuriferula plumbiphila]|uniref:DNA-binding response regulator n=1 Tax=Sulfuriferula plumbiphila TaxID=171865 RepID=A0A512L4Z3_9PROT|nr:response regulator [Sulfuriferula plumbiphila]BBP03262.1 DNA-binding response regulator [Sulfuriferula plumbiphila]GEP29549.1 DNA-binding response regulator [Sulfuriferula plumbiphila]